MPIITDIEAALCERLPAELHSDVPALAAYLADLLAKTGSPAERTRPQHPNLASLLEQLQGQTLPLSGQTIVFGDAAGGAIDQREGAFISGGSTTGPVIGVNRGAIINVTVAAGRIEVRRVPFMVPAVPDHYIPRPQEYDAIIAQLCDSQPGPVALTGLRGAGGFGKTTLAVAACHDEQVRATFPDGVLWVTLGEQPSQAELVAKIGDLIERLTESRPGFTSIEAATEALGDALGDRRILLIIDDVWDRAHLRPFLHEGRRCARLITTRMRDILPAASRNVDVDAMAPTEAVALLQTGLPDAGTHDSALRALAQRLGEWPVLLRLVNGALREQVARGKPLVAAIQYVVTGVTKKGVTVFDISTASDRSEAVARTLAVSLSLLDTSEAARYRELAIFPEDSNIPLATLTHYWGATGTLDEFDVEELCGKLFRLSLVLAFDATAQTIRLHDVVRGFLIQRAGADLARLHATLLDAHRPTSGTWADLREHEPYLWDTLAGHLRDANQHDELIAVVTDPLYIVAKCYRHTVLAFEKDCAIAKTVHTNNTQLQTLSSTIRQISHLLDVCTNPGIFSATLYSRIGYIDQLKPIAERLITILPYPYLIPFQPLPDLPQPTMIRTLRGHQSQVLACALSHSGSKGISASSDQTLIVWDILSGSMLFTIDEHDGIVVDCDMDGPGNTSVSISDKNIIKICDINHGITIHTLQTNADSLTCCSISCDGSLAVSGSRDGRVMLWDTIEGRLIFEFYPGSAGVIDCAISDDNSKLLICCIGGNVHYWDIMSREQLYKFHENNAYLTSCDFSPDGKKFILSSWKQVQVYDARSGSHMLTLAKHDRMIEECSFSGDGERIISSSWDGTIRVCDSKDGQILIEMYEQTGDVPGCALDFTGTTAISTSRHGIIRVWDTSKSITPFINELRGERTLSCDISTDGSTVAWTLDNKIIITNNTDSTTTHRTIIIPDLSLYSCSINLNINKIAVGSFDGSLMILDFHSTDILQEAKFHQDSIWDCSFSSSGKYIISASSDHKLILWDTENGKVIRELTGHTDSVLSCKFNIDETVALSSSSDGTVILWDLISGETKAIFLGHHSPVYGCDLSHNGRIAISTSVNGVLKIWNTHLGTEISSLQAENNIIWGCAISPDASLIATSSVGGSIKIWSILTSQCIAGLQIDGSLGRCAWFPDNRKIATVGSGGLYLLKLVD